VTTNKHYATKKHLPLTR